MLLHEPLNDDEVVVAAAAAAVSCELIWRRRRHRRRQVNKVNKWFGGREEKNGRLNRG
jgi:hypothetical protein